MRAPVVQEKFFRKEDFPYLWIAERSNGVCVKVHCPALLDNGQTCYEVVVVKLSPLNLQSGDQITATCRKGQHVETFQLTARLDSKAPGTLEDKIDVWGKIFPTV
ncbi:MAG: hypothetical protein WEC39_01020 [Patescibacteria group bacterium]